MSAPHAFRLLVWLSGKSDVKGKLNPIFHSGNIEKILPELNFIA
jgi:hypothetical protein